MTLMTTEADIGTAETEVDDAMTTVVDMEGIMAVTVLRALLAAIKTATSVIVEPVPTKQSKARHSLPKTTPDGLHGQIARHL